jgi:phage terminase large subunit-like protein
VRIWLLADDRVGVRCRFWVPRVALTKYPDRPYDQWERAGLLTVTEGDTTDMDLVEQTIIEDCQASGVLEVAYDKRFA